MVDPASERTIPRVVAAAAERFGNASAIEDGEIHKSFAELAAEGTFATRAFLAAGVGPGDRVAVWAPNIAEWVVAAIGLFGAGAVIFVFTPATPSGEQLHLCDIDIWVNVTTITDKCCHR